MLCLGVPSSRRVLTTLRTLCRFAERVDERLPYIDRGYVADPKKKKAEASKPAEGEDFFGNLKKMLGQK